MEIPKFNLQAIDIKYRIIGLIGICALIFAGYHDYIYKPHKKNIDTMKKEIEPLKSSMNIIRTIDYPTLKDDAQILNFIGRDLKGSAEKLTEEEKKLPQSVSVSEILQNITNLIASCRIEITTIKPQDITAANNYLVVPINVELCSTYYSYLELIKKLKNTPAKYEAVSITSSKDKPMLNIVFKLLVYARGK